MTGPQPMTALSRTFARLFVRGGLACVVVVAPMSFVLSGLLHSLPAYRVSRVELIAVGSSLRIGVRVARRSMESPEGTPCDRPG
jgi:hypothetical protein